MGLIGSCLVPSQQQLPRLKQPVSRAVGQLLSVENVAACSCPDLLPVLASVAQHLHNAALVGLEEVWLEHSEQHLQLVTQFAADLNFWIKANHGKELVILSMCQVAVIHSPSAAADSDVSMPYFHRLCLRAPTTSSRQTPSASAASAAFASVSCS